MNKAIFVLAAVAVLCSCSVKGSFSRSDKKIINTNKDSIFHVYVIDNPEENEVLRAISEELSIKSIKSDDFKLLAARLLKTVTDSTVDGVGIAAPQIGINKRVVAVQRYDKEGWPFEVYPNICIEEYSDSVKSGWEGCLSVPGRRERVVRSQWIVISYIDPETLVPARDTVKGYSSVIFQHETDHLEGIVYIDRVLSTVEAQ